MSIFNKFQLTRWLAGLLCLIAATSAEAMWPFGFYRFDAISGTVVDLDTRKPIEGVIVVGHWGLRRKLIMGSSYVGPLVVKETVTDKDGNFTLPASFATDIHKRGHYDAELFPVLAFFKSGHEFTVFRHNGSRPFAANWLKNWQRYPRDRPDEYLIERLGTDKSTLKEQYVATLLASSSFELIDGAGSCAAYQDLIPKLFQSLSDEHARLAKDDPELAKFFSINHSLYWIESCVSGANRNKKP